jgi:hypothetical protein
MDDKGQAIGWNTIVTVIVIISIVIFGFILWKVMFS